MFTLQGSVSRVVYLTRTRKTKRGAPCWRCRRDHAPQERQNRLTNSLGEAGFALAEQPSLLLSRARVDPLLRDDLGHFEARASYGRQHRNETWYNWDGWFYTMSLRLLFKLPSSGGAEALHPTQVARPEDHVPGGQAGACDGKVGIWRLVSEREAKNKKYVGPNEAARRVT